MAKTIVVSFSGGRTSAYMAWKILNSSEFVDRPKLFIFANTGKERPETLDFVNECDKRWGLDLVWVEAVVNEEKGVGTTYRIVSYETASRKGEPFEAMVYKYDIPTKDFPHCTRELKLRPIEKYIKSLGIEYEMAIGIRLDEAHRVANKAGFIYPLAKTWPTKESMVREFWDKQPFDLGLKDYQGNCDLCWKKSLRKRLTILKEEPSIGDQWAKWEADSDYEFDRDHLTIPQLIEMSKRPFVSAADKHELRKLEPGLDFERPCECFSRNVDGD